MRAKAATEEVVRTCCAHNCGGRSVLDCTVRNGRLVKVEPGPAADPNYSGACVRCLALPKWVYSPDRLQHPLRRVGARGEGRFERCTWDEALDTIAERFKAIKQEHGPGSIGFARSSGLPRIGAYTRLADLLQASNLYGGVDMAVHMGLNSTFGDKGMFGQITNEWTDLPNADLIMVWGHNPAETGMTLFRLMLDAQASGSRLVVIDPRFSATAMHADWWVSPRPGSDTALVLGMLHVVIEEGLIDRKFALTHTVAPLLVRLDTGRYLRESDVISGGSDRGYQVWDAAAGAPRPAGAGAIPTLDGEYQVAGVPVKTAYRMLRELAAAYPPERVAAVTGVAAADVRDLGRAYGQARAATIDFGYGVDRYYHADLLTRAAAALASLTGNLGRPGAGVGVGSHTGGARTAALGPEGSPLPSWAGSTGVPRIAVGQRPLPVRALFIAGDELNQRVADQNRAIAWAQTLDFVVVVDHFMQTSAQWADIVLPASTFLESTHELVDVQTNRNSLMLKRRVIEPLFESRPDFDIERDLAVRLGFGEHYQDAPETIIARQIEESPDPALAGISLERLLEANGNLRLGVPEDPNVQYDTLRFTTPTGRAEFYREDLVPFGEALPVYKDGYEASPDHPLARRYPLVFSQTHARQRAHSTFATHPWFLELWPEPVLELHPDDAAARSLTNGDLAMVYNDRGHMVVKVAINPDYPTGLCNITQGWKAGQYRSGHLQGLTNGAINPAHEAVWGHANMPLNDTRVEVCRVTPEEAANGNP